ncbi:hypothetical protein C8R48DRAFT_775787 [Suillus tomentosus]|nr:hypothetical protein C8R48DRAFT_775787 [Suillus tomentosus]
MTPLLQFDDVGALPTELYLFIFMYLPVACSRALLFLNIGTPSQQTKYFGVIFAIHTAGNGARTLLHPLLGMDLAMPSLFPTTKASLSCTSSAYFCDDYSSRTFQPDLSICPQHSFTPALSNPISSTLRATSSSLAVSGLISHFAKLSLASLPLSSSTPPALPLSCEHPITYVSLRTHRESRFSVSNSIVGAWASNPIATAYSTFPFSVFDSNFQSILHNKVAIDFEPEGKYSTSASKLIAPLNSLPLEVSSDLKSASSSLNGFENQMSSRDNLPVPVTTARKHGPPPHLTAHLPSHHPTSSFLPCMPTLPMPSSNFGTPPVEDPAAISQPVPSPTLSVPSHSSNMTKLDIPASYCLYSTEMQQLVPRTQVYCTRMQP